MSALPSFRSGLFLLAPRIYVADRDNTLGEDITSKVTSAMVDYDIDRQGSKGQLNIATWDYRYLEAGTWIAPFLDVVQEGVGLTTAQMGLFEMSEPTVSMINTIHGAEGTGEDIIAIMERAVMTEPDVTVKGHNVMDDVRRSIQIATCRGRGPELAPNPSFKNGLDGIAGGSNNGMVMTRTHNTVPPYGRAAGVVRHESSPASPENSSGYSYYNPSIPVPAGARYIRGEIRVLVNPIGTQTMLSVIFLDENDLQVTRHNDTIVHDQVNVWRWHSLNVEVPDGAVAIRFIWYTFGMPGTTLITRWDDASVREIVALPIPRERIALPDYPKAASTAIPHHANIKWTTRINDLLKAIGHHAVHATLDGRPTSRPMRDPRTDTPTRVYTHGEDARIVTGARTERSSSNLYNVVVAVKEDYESGESWVAVARNDDPDHPWSTREKGEIAPINPVQSNDAVDLEELQAIADDQLAQSSVQQSVTMDVTPDPGLTVYDIISIENSDGPEAGRWAIESMSCGLTTDNPIVTLTARRTSTYKSPE